jgi:hypothetical protein
MRAHLLAAIGLCVSLAAAPLLSQPADPQSLPLKFAAFAVSLGGPNTRSGTAQVEIAIERWSTEAERQRLLDALKKGQDNLLDTLRELRPVGHIRTPETLAYDLRYASQAPGEDGGQRLFLATDRPIGFWEAVNRPRSIDYPFTFIELRVNTDGEGEGKLSIATKVRASRDGRHIELENYGAQPVMLNEVRRTN